MNKENKNPKEEWHWLTGGILVSLLSVATYLIFEWLQYRNYPFGVTSGFGYISARFSRLFSGLSENSYFMELLGKPSGTVEFFILVGLIIGGFLASKLSRTYSPENIPAVWIKYKGESIAKRYIFVITGSVLLGYGAGLANGCTTGNILQGWAHLSLGSIVAGASFFAAGIITAKILYREKGGQNVGS